MRVNVRDSSGMANWKCFHEKDTKWGGLDSSWTSAGLRHIPSFLSANLSSQFCYLIPSIRIELSYSDCPVLTALYCRFLNIVNTVKKWKFASWPGLYWTKSICWNTDQSSRSPRAHTLHKSNTFLAALAASGFCKTLSNSGSTQFKKDWMLH